MSGPSNAWSSAQRRKSSNALSLFCSTPSPSAYIRPSRQSANALPFSAASNSPCTAFALSPNLNTCAPAFRSSTVIGRFDWSSCTVVKVPSNGMGCAAAKPTPATTMSGRTLDIRITRLLGRPAGMRHRAVLRGADLLGVLPQIAGAELAGARLPFALAFGELGCGELHVEAASLGVNFDDVAVAHERDRSADRGFRPDVTDAETARRTGETAIGDERDLAAHALTVKRRRSGEHLAHAGAAPGVLIADHEDIALFVLLLRHRLEAGLLAIEAARRTGEFQDLHAGNHHDG